MIIRNNEINNYPKEKLYFDTSACDKGFLYHKSFFLFKQVLWFKNYESSELCYRIYEKVFFIFFFWWPVCIGTQQVQFDTIEECQNFVKTKWPIVKNIPVWESE